MDSELYAFGRDRFVGMLREIPTLAIGVIEAIEFKAKRLANLAQILATSSVPARLKLLLVNLAALYGKQRPSGVLILVPFTHEEIAGMVGASRPWVSTMLARLKDVGALRIEGRLMAIPDLARLKRLDFTIIRETL